MTLEYLAEKKTQYENKYIYYKNIEFDGLANAFKGVVDLIEEMENYTKETKTYEQQDKT
jgi:hypothetical protein